MKPRRVWLERTGMVLCGVALMAAVAAGCGAVSRNTGSGAPVGRVTVSNDLGGVGRQDLSAIPVPTGHIGGSARGALTENPDVECTSVIPVTVFRDRTALGRFDDLVPEAFDFASYMVVWVGGGGDPTETVRDPALPVAAANGVLLLSIPVFEPCAGTGSGLNGRPLGMTSALYRVAQSDDCVRSELITIPADPGCQSL